MKEKDNPTACADMYFEKDKLTLKKLTQNAQNIRKRVIPIHHIVIEKDGWVWVSTNDGHEMGLGDLDVDVEIIDRRT